MSCNVTPNQYCTLTTAKIAVARFHLREFERLLNDGPSPLPGADPESTYAPIHGHADGVVFETFAAFDAYSCAVAHRWNLTRSDKASFATVAGDSRVPAQVARRIKDTVATARWKRLEALRNLAGHRGVVSQHLVWGSHLPGGFQIFLPSEDDSSQRGDEFLPVVRDLLRWSEGRLRFLFSGVCREAFTRRGRILQLRGSMVRVQAVPDE